MQPLPFCTETCNLFNCEQTPSSAFSYPALMPPNYTEWKRKLLFSAGTAYLDVEALGEFILQYLYRDGCEPSMTALLHYVESGLHPTYEARQPARQARALAAPPP